MVLMVLVVEGLHLIMYYSAIVNCNKNKHLDLVIKIRKNIIGFY